MMIGSSLFASQNRIYSREDFAIAAVFLIVFLAFLGCILAVPIQLPTDGHEYIGTVGSLLHTHNMHFEPEDLDEALKFTSPETFFVDREIGQNTKRNLESQQLSTASIKLKVTSL